MLLVASTAHAGPLLYSYVGDTFHKVQGVYTQDVSRITGHFILSEFFVLPPPDSFSNVLVDVTPDVLRYRFTDGHQVVTEANSIARFQVGFDLEGNPVVPGSTPGFTGRWRFEITTPLSGMYADYDNHGENQSWAWMGGPERSEFEVCESSPDRFCYVDPLMSQMNMNDQVPWLDGDQGTWTITEVPEPSTLMLTSMGLLWLTARARRCRRLGAPQ
jgi:hypothetical protein